MRKFNLLLVLTLFVTSLFAQTSRRVIMLTVDGLRPEFYLSNKWNAPNLKQMVQRGAYAEGVVSVFPSMTFPSHTTMITGVAPETHGVYYNSPFEPESSNGSIYWNFKQIASPTIWEAARNKGLKVASLVWPVSAEAPVDFNIPDIGGMGNTVLEKYSVPEGITTTLKEQVLGGAEKINIGDDMGVAKIAAWVIKNEKPHLMTIHIFGLDHKEHAFGREGDEVQKGLSIADSSVGIIWNAIKESGLEDSTLFIVLGDHGFYDADKSLNPNVLLSQAGLIRDGDWDARFHTVGGAAFLFVKNNDKTIITRVKRILKKLPNSQKKYFRVIEPAKMKAIGADPNAVLALSALSGASFGGASKGAFISERKGGVHGHFPDTKNIQTGFIAVGNTVNSNHNLNIIHLYDVAPTVLQYLKLDLQSQLKGSVPKTLFRESIK